MKLILVTVFFLSIGYLTIAEEARYDNYRVYKLSIDNVKQLELLQEMERFPDGYRFFEPPVNIASSVNLMVPPHKFAEFHELTVELEVTTDLIITDLQKVVDAERPKMSSRASTMNWIEYQRLDVIYEFLDSLVENYPDQVTPILIGYSYEGRPIRGVKLSYKENNPGVFIESNIHAREWVSSAATTYFLNEFLTSSDPEVREIAENYDFYFVPVANPDGFEYTHTTDRMWRKTRTQHSILCRGADPNRNFGFAFMMGGSSNIPCTDTFAGPYEFSEPETKALSDYFLTLSNVTTYLAFHSYQQLMLLPYGHTTEHLGEYDNLMAIGQKAIDKLAERFGTSYRIGSIAEAIYVASGGSIDWVAGTTETKVNFGFELRDNGFYGFLLPPDQIIPTAMETLDAVIVILKEAKALGYH